LRLLFRFYEVEKGRITIDGQDLREIQLESLRKSIGVVPQDTPLFHSDILHNIRYGRLDASDEEVKDAARKAEVYETVERLPDKWHTKVGERGLMISGGEKQRLAVARLLLKDAPILFFDEAVSFFPPKFSPCLDCQLTRKRVYRLRLSIRILRRTSCGISIAR
jgi:ATP-binding cassette subfamily B (MDR/TAP) protein 7